MCFGWFLALPCCSCTEPDQVFSWTLRRPRHEASPVWENQGTRWWCDMKVVMSGGDSLCVECEHPDKRETPLWERRECNGYQENCRKKCCVQTTDERDHLTFSICISFCRGRDVKIQTFRSAALWIPPCCWLGWQTSAWHFPDLIQQHIPQQWWWTSFQSEQLELNWKMYCSVSHRATWGFILDVCLSASIWNKPHSSSHLPSVGKDPPWTRNCLCCSQSGAALGQLGQQFLCAVCLSGECARRDWPLTAARELNSA